MGTHDPARCQEPASRLVIDSAALLPLGAGRCSRSGRASLGSRGVLEPRRRGPLLCQAALRRGPRGYAQNIRLPSLSQNEVGLLPKPRGAPHGPQSRRPGPPPRSVTRSKHRSPRATAPREGAAGRRRVYGRGIRHDVRAPLRRASGKPTLLWASICPLFWEPVGPKGGPCWLGLPAGCRRQEATSVLRGHRNPRRPWWGWTQAPGLGLQSAARRVCPGKVLRALGPSAQ